MTMLFPDLTYAEVMNATHQTWDLDGPVPIPRSGSWLSCPVCRHHVVQPRHWRFHQRSDSVAVQGRCDVSFKCCACAAVWYHGVALDINTWNRMSNGRPLTLHWRDAKRLLEAAE